MTTMTTHDVDQVEASKPMKQVSYKLTPFEKETVKG